MFNVVCRSVGNKTDVQLQGIMQGSVKCALNNKNDSKHGTNAMQSKQCGKQLIPYHKGLFFVMFIAILNSSFHVFIFTVNM